MITIEQAQTKLNALPPPSTITRTQYDKLYLNEWFHHNNHQIALRITCKCLGPYGPEQPIEYTGCTLQVWIDHHRSAQRTITPGTDLTTLIPILTAEAMTICDHAGSIELTQDTCRARNIKHFGMHYHIHECPKCGQQYSTDSSG